MFIKLLALFTIVPIIELSLLIKLGGYIGIIPTVLLVGLTGVAGISLARGQGLLVISRIKSNLEQGIIPTDDLIGGLLILSGGIMLLTPGLLTDITGFFFILPGSRHLMAGFCKNWFKKYIKNSNIGYQRYNFKERNDHSKDYVDIEVDNGEEQ